MADGFDWVDEQEKKIKSGRSQGYFDIEEGENRFVLLTHCAPFAQVFEGGKYRPAKEGDTNVSIRGVCWVWQDGAVKQAKLPYKVVAAIRGIQQNPDWEFKLPFPHVLSLTAIGAGTKEVKYTLTPSPKEVKIPEDILADLTKKPSPEDTVERLKGGTTSTPTETTTATKSYDYPTSDINPDDIPFD